MESTRTLIILFIAGLTINIVYSIAVPHYHDIEHHEPKKPHIPILKSDYQTNHHGYEYSYETGNGIHVQETGYIKNKGDKKHETLVQQGTITYHDEHGHPITLTYIADEHGFQPQGAHLPTPPPIPAEIAKALHDNAQHSLEQSHGSTHEVAEEGQHEYGHY